MKTIEIDDGVFAYLQSLAIPYIETTPNLTLRRLFNLNGKPSSEGISKSQILHKAGKNRKANLPELVKAGLLQEGQTLYLYDYQGRRVERYEATISGNSLLRNGNPPSSMSSLAVEGLKLEGFISESVRGPAHWCNSDGISVKDLWSHLLK